MQHWSAILLTAWVFVISPLLCTSGLALHVCDAQDACHSCQTEQCPDGHGCHRDPCRVDATLPRPDLLQANPCLAQCDTATPLLSLSTDFSIGETAPIVAHPPDTAKRACPDAGALTLPLLV